MVKVVLDRSTTMPRMTKSEIAWGAAFAVIAAVGPVLTQEFLVPWMRGWDFSAANEGVRSVALKIVGFFTYPVEVSLVTLLSFALIAASIFQLFRHYRSDDSRKTSAPARGLGKVESPVSSITEAKILELMELADAHARPLMMNRKGQQTRGIRLLQNGLSSDDVSLLNVLSLTNTEPVPLAFVNTVFANNKVAMQVTLRKLQGKGLVSITREHVVLTEAGLEWAHQELRRGLGKKEVAEEALHIKQSQAQELIVNKEQAFVLATLSLGEGSMALEQLYKQTTWSSVRLEHAIDKLQEMRLAETFDTADGRVLSLTAKGRAYVVGNNLDALA